MQSWREPSRFLTNNTGVPCGDRDGWMKPEARCLLRNSQSALVSVSESEYMRPSGGTTPGGVTILRSYGW